MQMSGHLSPLRQKLWRACAALARTLRQLQRTQPMVQGSFYLLRRKCGKPNCRCATGPLHASWVLTRSEAGQDRIYSVPKEQRAQVRRWAWEYRRYQRARAALAKAHPQLLALAASDLGQRPPVHGADRPDKIHPHTRSATRPLFPFPHCLNCSQNPDLLAIPAKKP
jgi:hypothetical protein